MAQALRSGARERRSILFRLDEQRYAIDAENVVEVIRRPLITRVPHGPAGLAGIANLRGVALPVVDLNSLLTGKPTAHGANGRVIVYDRGNRVGLIVDEVLRFGAAGDADSLVEFDLDARLDAAFKGAMARPARLLANSGAALVAEVEAEEVNSLLSFRIAGQFYALPLESVHEVLTMPDTLAAAVGAESAVLGLMNLRDSILPVISLASLLGLVSEAASERVVVIESEGASIGLAVDQMDALRRLPQNMIDAVPAVLKRGSGSAEIEAIGRVDNGRTLISILSVQKLFGHHAVEKIIDQSRGAVSMPSLDAKRDAQEQFLIFRLGEETYGLPIGAVDEVIRVSDAITRLPNAPSFVSGVMNLRGKPLPLIDQRSRFEASAAEAAIKPRAVVLTIDRLQAGFIVDSVSEVMSIDVSALAEAPDFASDGAEVFDRIAHIEAEGRMFLIVDPKELLSRAERDVLASLTETKSLASET
jgi:purine-binding chemotaxis protein CheW